MKKRIQIINFILFLTLYNCGSVKNIVPQSTNKKLLEKEFQKFKNTPYKFGGIDSRGFDCSGFVNTVFKNAFSVKLPRTTTQMSSIGKNIKRNQLKIGDLVFFQPSKKYKHVGIYMGNNLFMHSSTSKGVIKSSLTNVYWTKKYKYARRILK